jgi:hypothetical protein
MDFGDIGLRALQCGQGPPKPSYHQQLARWLAEPGALQRWHSGLQTQPASLRGRRTHAPRAGARWRQGPEQGRRQRGAAAATLARPARRGDGDVRAGEGGASGLRSGWYTVSSGQYRRPADTGGAQSSQGPGSDGGPGDGAICRCRCRRLSRAALVPTSLTPVAILALRRRDALPSWPSPFLRRRTTRLLCPVAARQPTSFSLQSGVPQPCCG